MPNEWPYRIALLVIIIATMSIVIYYRWQATRSGERISHQREGYAFATALRLTGLSLWGCTFAYLVGLLPEGGAWSQWPLPGWLRWSSVAMAALCPPGMLWILSHLGKNLTDTVVTRQQATLITSGPYRWVRHPFYLNAALLIGAVTGITAQWPIGLSGLLVLLLLVVRTDKEERILMERFGDAYRDYARSTGRFLPRLRSHRHPPLSRD